MIEVTTFTGIEYHVDKPDDIVYAIYDHDTRFIWDLSEAKALYLAPRFVVRDDDEREILLDILKKHTYCTPILDDTMKCIYPRMNTFQLMSFIAHHPQYWDCYYDGYDGLESYST